MVKQPAPFLYLEIAESLRRRIVSGELQPGDKLPPVREMARRWGCTPGTVSRAYAQLGRDGLVAGHRGGGTRVMPSALQAERPAFQWVSLVNRAEQFLLEAISTGHTPAQAESALSVAISRWRDVQREGVPQPASAAGATGLRFAGSHDLAVEIVARMLAEETPEARLSIEYVGSLGGLMALAQGEAEVAGAHLWDEPTDTYNVSFVQRLLPGCRVALLTLAHRSLGLITPSGNPQGLQGLADLARPGVRLVNRQPGSGTRVWLDAQLKALEIVPQSVSGYDREELTHLAVARAVDEGEATAGQGTNLGYRFEHLAWLMMHTPEGKRLGVCLDTCHVFAAGYELRTPEGYAATTEAFDRVIGLEELKAIHLNDSKGTLGSRKDRHEHIGKGHIGLEGFRHMLNDARLAGLPGLLETPKSDDLHEDRENLAVLRSLVSS